MEICFLFLDKVWFIENYNCMWIYYFICYLLKCRKKAKTMKIFMVSNNSKNQEIILIHIWHDSVDDAL